jgi:polar amino acid transport system substrate-binding protein
VTHIETLRVGAAFPDSPFNGMSDGTGLDIDLMTSIAKSLGAEVKFVAYGNADFNGIFDGLGVA